MMKETVSFLCGAGGGVKPIESALGQRTHHEECKCKTVLSMDLKDVTSLQLKALFSFAKSQQQRHELLVTYHLLYVAPAHNG